MAVNPVHFSAFLRGMEVIMVLGLPAGLLESVAPVLLAYLLRIPFSLAPPLLFSLPALAPSPGSALQKLLLYQYQNLFSAYNRKY
jgi:hypothetical protein